MKPIQVLKAWIDRFNAADIDGLIALYYERMGRHGAATRCQTGRARHGFIRDMLTEEKCPCLIRIYVS